MKIKVIDGILDIEGGVMLSDGDKFWLEVDVPEGSVINQKSIHHVTIYGNKIKHLSKKHRLLKKFGLLPKNLYAFLVEDDSIEAGMKVHYNA